MSLWRYFWDCIDRLCEPVAGSLCVLLLLLASSGNPLPSAGLKLTTFAAPIREAITSFRVDAILPACPLRALPAFRLGR